MIALADVYIRILYYMCMNLKSNRLDEQNLLLWHKNSGARMCLEHPLERL